MTLSSVGQEGEQSAVKWPVPLEFRKGELRRDERASVDSGRNLLRLMDTLKPLEQARILDWGCGCKISQAIVEYDISVRQYVGVDIDRPMLDHLIRTNPLPTVLSYLHRDIQNAMYNPDGPPMRDVLLAERDLQVGAFDLVTMFSVITHMSPDDTRTLLTFLRTRVHEDGVLLFTAFVNDEADVNFYDQEPDKPLLRATYRRSYLEHIIEASGWRIQLFALPEPDGLIRQPRFVCHPI